MPQTEHARFAPSSAARIIKCPGAAKIIALVPPAEDTIESREGSASHWAGAELLHDRIVAAGSIAPNGVILNDEMIEAAEMWADYIIARDGAKRMYGIIETRIAPCDDLHFDNWGTPDYRMFDPETFTLHIDDYKYGHVYVEAYENWQCLNYAILALAELGIDGHDDQRIKVVITITQPRNYHPDGPIRAWTLSGSDLRGYRNKLRSAFEAADDPNAKCIASVECEFCPARHACPAAIAAGYRAVQHAYDSNPLVMSPEAMGLELLTIRRAMKMLKARETGMSEQVLSTIVRQGKSVPYFRIEHGNGRTKFREESIKDVIELAKILDPTRPLDISKPGVMTPLQAIKAGFPKELAAAYSYTPTGAAELVEDDGHHAAKVFKS